eukprot:5300189-Amphidinium_carterae.1
MTLIVRKQFLNSLSVSPQYKARAPDMAQPMQHGTGCMETFQNRPFSCTGNSTHATLAQNTGHKLSPRPNGFSISIAMKLSAHRINTCPHSTAHGEQCRSHLCIEYRTWHEIDDLNHHENEGPPCIGNPLARDKWHHQPMKDKQAIAGLGLRCGSTQMTRGLACFN